ncbi:cation diffusion facilitator family transporter [Haloimpatiens sp. FM7330]|uniref:cation diffusion facilitator family transporter n=1 Tax=Haloimpatiens sp. FM7330 TaxID=3298610 RepID=UPI00363757D4
MFSNFLISHFIKDYRNTDNDKVRQSYGYLGGIIGIITNLLLSSIKLVVGFISNSIAITADAFNNLSDAASSIITVISFKLANKPADKEHPFGHGRIEYVSALIVSFLVMLVGFEFIKTSFNRVMHPTKIKFKLIPFVIILVSILIKVWLGFFNKKLGNQINSSTLKASSIDAFSDVISSSVVALSFFLSTLTSIPIDGYIGILISLFIIYSGFTLVKETISPLLGEAPDPKLVKNIKNELLKYNHITGVHDIIIHSYGPSKFMISLHAEVPCNISVLKLHEIIDKAERDISKKFNVLLVIHMDPINTDDKKVAKCKDDVLAIIKDFPIIKSIHDFRMVGENNYINLIFDIVISVDVNLSNNETKELLKNIDKKLKQINSSYNTVITVDKDFTGVS